MKPIPELTNEELRVELCGHMGWIKAEKVAFWRNAGRKLFHQLELPNFPIDPGSALTLCDALAEKGWDAFSVLRYKTGPFTVIFGKEPRTTVKGEGPTLPLAISRAALAVFRSMNAELSREGGETKL